jgi:hypothetical protein
VLLLSSTLTLAGSAHAARVTWLIQGTVSFVGSGLASQVPTGSAFSYELTFESSTPGQRSPFSHAYYTDAVLALSFEAGSLSLAMAPGERATMSALDLTFNVSGPAAPAALTIREATFSGGVGLPVPPLPIAPPAYPNVSSVEFRIGPDDIYTQNFHTSYVVPEAEGALLALAGLGLSAALRRARSRGARPRARPS